MRTSCHALSIHLFFVFAVGPSLNWMVLHTISQDVRSCVHFFTVPELPFPTYSNPSATKYKFGIDPRHSASDIAHLHTPLLGSHAHALCLHWGDNHGHVASANNDPLRRIPLKNISLFSSIPHPRAHVHTWLVDQTTLELIHRMVPLIHHKSSTIHPT